MNGQFFTIYIYISCTIQTSCFLALNMLFMISVLYDCDINSKKKTWNNTTCLFILWKILTVFGPRPPKFFSAASRTLPCPSPVLMRPCEELLGAKLCEPAEIRSNVKVELGVKVHDVFKWESNVSTFFGTYWKDS